MKILIAADGSSYTKRMLADFAAHDEWLGPKHQYTVVHSVLAVPHRAARFRRDGHRPQLDSGADPSLISVRFRPYWTDPSVRRKREAMRWITRSLVATGVLTAAVFGLATYGRARWAAATRRQRARLEATRLPPTVTHYDANELEGLPAPVQRYFRAVLRDGQLIVTAVTVEHTGTFNLSQNGETWRAFTRALFAWRRWASSRSPICTDLATWHGAS